VNIERADINGKREVEIPHRENHMLVHSRKLFPSNAV